MAVEELGGDEVFVPARSLARDGPPGLEVVPDVGAGAVAPRLALRAGVVHLRAAAPYVLTVEEGGLDRSELAPLAPCLRRVGRSGRRAVLDFGFRAARASLGRLELLVHPPPPFRADAFSRMLADLSRQAAQLLFDCGGPTRMGLLGERLREREALYPLFRFLHYAMREAPPDERLDACWAQVARSPHTTTYRECVVEAIHAASAVGEGTLTALARRPSALTLLGEESALRRSAAGRSLARGGRSWFPERVQVERIRVSLDTAENRFLKYLLGLLREIMDDAASAFRRDGGFGSVENEAEARALGSELRRLGRADFLKGVGRLLRFPGQSQVLRKRTGYRELTRLYHLLFLAGQLGWDDLAAIENRRLDVLYEYWTWFRVVEALRALHGGRRRPTAGSLTAVRSGLLLDLSRRGQVCLDFPARPGRMAPCRVVFCRTFAAGDESWSLDFRPTVVVETASGRRLALDATLSGGGGRSREELVGRLHALRDGAGCRAALAVAPDLDAAFFSVRGSFPGFEQCGWEDVEGVGLLPLRPGADEDGTRLLALLRAFLLP